MFLYRKREEQITISIHQCTLASHWTRLPGIFPEVRESWLHSVCSTAPATTMTHTSLHWTKLPANIFEHNLPAGNNCLLKSD